MNRFEKYTVVEDHTHGASDGIDRRNFLGCMAWAGTGMTSDQSDRVDLQQ